MHMNHHSIIQPNYYAWFLLNSYIYMNIILSGFNFDSYVYIIVFGFPVFVDLHISSVFCFNCSNSLYAYLIRLLLYFDLIPCIIMSYLRSFKSSYIHIHDHVMFDSNSCMCIYDHASCLIAILIYMQTYEIRFLLNL